MKYKLPSGKNITIPDDEIKKGIELLGLTKEESIQMYLEDNSYAFNYEQEELEEITKGQRVDHGSTDKTKRKTPSKPKVYKNSDEKVALANYLKEKLNEYATTNGFEFSEMIKEKKYRITKGDVSLAIDIVQNRKKVSTE